MIGNSTTTRRPVSRFLHWVIAAVWHGIVRKDGVTQRMPCSAPQPEVPPLSTR